MINPTAYRKLVKNKGLVSFEVMVKETNILFSAERLLREEAVESILRHRHDLESYIELYPLFLSTLKPYPVTESMPPIVRTMAEAGIEAGVGPMAAVAGAMADYVGKDLLEFSHEIIVENGGDIFIKTNTEKAVNIYCEKSQFGSGIGIKIDPEQTPIGICSSSGTTGHSFSFGKADLVTILAGSSALADAVATSVCNRVKAKSDVEGAIAFCQSIPAVKGIIIIIDDYLSAWGDIKTTTI
ncbi:hypothetical protein ES708_12592 [subsurface metagenome]